jgi:adenylate cyclase
MSVVKDAVSATPTEVLGAVLFTDLVGFTDYTDGLGDAAAVLVLELQRALVEDVLATCDRARVVKELGDGLMIWFATAGEGIRSACRLMWRLEAARRERDFPLAVRMGLHHGEAVARGDDLVGGTVNIASRVCDLAGPGELLVSDAVLTACDAADRPTGMEALGPAWVKGVRDPVWLHRLDVGHLSELSN